MPRVVWCQLILADDSTGKNHVVIIAMIIVCDQQQPNIATIIAINIQQPLPTSEIAPPPAEDLQAIQETKLHWIFAFYDKGDLFTRNQQYLCVGASLYFSSYFFVEECTEDKDAN